MTLRQFDRLFRTAVADSLDEGCRAVADGVERQVPRLTGKLAGTLAVEPAHPEGASIVASVSIGGEDDPAGPVEFGTADQAPKPFWRPSLPAAGPAFLNSLRSALPR